MLVAAVAAVLLTADLLRSPERQLTAEILLAGVRAYQAVGHGVFPRGECRFTPTCSTYAAEVIEEQGALMGGALAARRLLRCGPWTPEGTADPPPEASNSRLPTHD